MAAFGISEFTIHGRSRANRRFFTLDHAHRALPLVTRIVQDIVDQQKRVSDLESNLHPRHDLNPDEMDDFQRMYTRQNARLIDLVEELSLVGCELKDWRRGLVDFPSRLRGRAVELCWRLGEVQIGYWHEHDAGFMGRRPIDEHVAWHLNNP